MIDNSKLSPSVEAGKNQLRLNRSQKSKPFKTGSDNSGNTLSAISSSPKHAATIHPTPSGSQKNATTMAELMKKHGDFVKPLKKGDKVKGKVIKLTPQEILLDIGYKSYALVIEYDKQKLENLLSIINLGDEVTASVISPEAEEGFPVVSLRRMLDEKVYGKLEDLFKGQKSFEVTILDVTRGGYFVATNDGTRGFLPNSQVIKDNFNQNDKVNVKMIEFDKEKKRVIFSQKATKYLTDAQILKNIIKPNERIRATVTTVVPYGIYVEFEKDKNLIEGFIHISEVSSERVEGLMDKFKTGETMDVNVIEIDSSNNRVNLSLKALAADEFVVIKEKYKIEMNVKGKVLRSSTRGVEVDLGDAKGFIQSTKVPSGMIFETGSEVEGEVVGYDDRSKRILLSPVLKTKFIGYR